MNKTTKRVVPISERTLRNIVTRIVEAQSARKQKLSWYGDVKGTKEGLEAFIMAYEGNPQKKGADIHVPASGVVDFKMVIPTTKVGNATTTPGDEMIKKTYNNLKTKAQQWQNSHKNEYKFRNTIPEYEDIRNSTKDTRTIKGEDFPPHKKKLPVQISQKEEKEVRGKTVHERIHRQFKNASKVLLEQTPTTDPTVTKALKAKTDEGDRTSLVVYHAQQIAKLAEKQPEGGLTEKGIGKIPEFKDSVNVIKKHIKFI